MVGANLRTARAFRVPHLQQNATIGRGLDPEHPASAWRSAQTIQSMVDERMSDMVTTSRSPSEP